MMISSAQTAGSLIRALAQDARKILQIFRNTM
jgi:hypothetical protein